MALSREQIEPVLQSVSPWLSNANITGLTVGPKAGSGRDANTLSTAQIRAVPSVRFDLTR